MAHISRIEAILDEFCRSPSGDRVEPSKYQRDIFYACLGSNLLIQAVAGSGKSWTIKVVYRILEAIRGGSTCLVAFNYHIAKVLKEAGYNAKTVNGLGYASIMWKGKEFFGHTPVMDPNDEKIDDLIYKTVPNDHLTKFGPQVKQMAQLARGVAAGTPKCIEKGLKPLFKTSREFYIAMIDRYGINFDEPAEDMGVDPEKLKELAMGYADTLLSACNLDTTRVDFQDQKAFPVLYNLPMRKWDNLLTDESQDFNQLDLELIRRSSRPTSRIVAVGDRNQSIYAWRGADVNSMDNIKRAFNCQELPLSICYRCPTSHIELAKKFVPHIEARPGAPVGSITHLRHYNHTHFPKGSIVICRMNAPLFKLAFRLLRNRVPVKLMGRDMAKGLITLLRKFDKAWSNPKRVPMEGETELMFAQSMLQAWRDGNVAKAEAQRKPKKVEAILDQFGVIAFFLDEAEHNATIRSVIDNIQEVLSTENNDGKECVTLSSIHRMKGGEADVVFILDTFLMPMKSASTPAQMQEEANLEYVANTRSRDMLFFVDTDKWKDL